MEQTATPPPQAMVSSSVICALSVLLFFLSLVLDFRSFLIFSLVILITYGGTRLWSRLSARSINCYLELDTYRVFAGECIHLTLAVENAKWLPIGFSIQMSGTFTDPYATAENAIHRQGTMLWFEKIMATQTLKAGHRGIYDMGTARLTTGDMFGFFRNTPIHPPPRRLIVYPRKIDILPPSIALKTLFGIPAANALVRDPVYLEGTTDYQPGTPAKYIHWKASARHLRLQAKLFEPTVHLNALLILDVNGFAVTPDEDAFEQALEVIAALVLQLDPMGFPVGFITNGTITGAGRSVIPPKKKHHQAADILATLAGVKTAPRYTMETLLRTGLSRCIGASCVYVSHTHDETASHARAYMKQLRLPGVFIFSTAGESSRAPAKGTWMTMNDLIVSPEKRELM